MPDDPPCMNLYIFKVSGGRGSIKQSQLLALKRVKNRFVNQGYCKLYQQSILMILIAYRY